MSKGLKEGQFLLIADGKQIDASGSASEILDKHNALKRKGKYKVITTLKVILHNE